MTAHGALAFEGVCYHDQIVDFDLEVERGEMVVLCGVEDTGVLFRLALGMAVPGRGTVWTLGQEPMLLRDADLRSLRSRCSLVPRAGTVISNTTVRMNVALPLLYWDRAGVDDRVDGALAELGLTHLASARPAALSREQRRLVALARARAVSPELLLLHDPYEGMTEEICQRTEETLAGMAREGCSSLVITAVTQVRSTYSGRLGERDGRRVVVPQGVGSAR